MSDQASPPDEPTGHPSLDDLADLDEGLLSENRRAEVTDHLSGCIACRERAETIPATRAALADLPPVTMPPAVRNRIAAALAAEPPLAATDTEQTSEPDVHSSTVVPDAADIPRRNRFGRPSAAALAAAAAVVLAGGAILVGHFHHHSSTDEVNAAGSGTVASPDATNPLNLDLRVNSYVKKATGANYNASDLPDLTASLLGSSTPSSAAHGATTNSAGSARGKAPVAGPEAPMAGAGVGTATSAKVPAALMPLYQSRQKLAACAFTLTGNTNATPEVIGFGHWTTSGGMTVPAAVFVFRTNTASVAKVFVVDQTCSPATLAYQEVSTP